MEISGSSFDFDDVFNSSSPDKAGGGGGGGAGDAGGESMESASNEGESSGMGSNKLEKSRQSARECRARKKLRYQYLDDMISEREKANLLLRDELKKYVSWCQQIDSKHIPDGLQEFLSSDQYKNSGGGSGGNSVAFGV